MSDFSTNQNSNYSLYCIKTTIKDVELGDKCPEVTMARWDGEKKCEWL